MIGLLGFRKSHKHFFEKLLGHCNTNKVNILTTRYSMKISFEGMRYLGTVDLKKACVFAVAEFYAKNSIKIPKIFLIVFFRVLSWINFLRYYALLDDSYEKVLIWNGGKFRETIAIEVAKIRDIKVYFFENGLLPNTLVFDAKGINANNSVPREREFYENYQGSHDLPQNLVPRIGKDREDFKGEKGVLPPRYIFVPFQVDSDTQILTHSPWIKNMRMLFDIIEALSKQSMYYFVLKEHPSSSVIYKDLHERSKGLTRVGFYNSSSTQLLIEKSKAIITVNSTVGIEGLLFYKKVIVLGNSFYAIDGICWSVVDFDALFDSIENIEKYELNKALIRQFLSYLYHDYLIPKDGEEYKEIYKRLVFSQKERVDGK
jgi:capsular polysaccharide export protein